MSTYKLIGQRFVRKYTAAQSSPVYAAKTDAQLIVDSLCDVKWEKVNAKDARMTNHTEDNVGTVDDPITGLDMNVIIRDEFDAALFCAGHKGGQHRACANAAVYRYTMPDGAVGKSMTSVKLSVTSDPYNSNGARIHVMTNSTGVIPTNCHTCRGEDSSGNVIDDGTTASRVAVRTAQTISGKEYWYPTNADCTISPTGGLILQRYLFVFVLMESYSTVRGNWIEGCSFIRNLVELTTSTTVTGWTDGDTIDLSEPFSSSAFTVASGGVIPGIPAGSPTGIIRITVRSDANLLVENDGRQSRSRDATGILAASALGRLYETLYSSRFDVVSNGEFTFQDGAYFNITRHTENHVSDGYDRPSPTDVLSLESRALVIPFAVPRTFIPSKVNLAFSELSMSPGALFNVFLAEGYHLSLTAEQLKDPGLYDQKGHPYQLLGTIDGGSSASFSVDLVGRRYGTLVITGWLPPDAYSVTIGGTQGTGLTPFMPNVTISE